MEYSGIWKRIISFLIDMLIIGIFSGYFIYIGLWYVFPAVWFIYFVLFEGSAMQATPGKKIVGIKITDSKGNPIDYGTSFIRTISKLLSMAILCIGFLMAIFSDKRKTLHDTLADTVVIDSNHLSQIGYSQHSNGGGATIIGVTGEFAGKIFPINTSGIMIGRDKTACKIVFSDNAQGISRHHCLISYSKQTRLFILNDVGSSNGTFVEKSGEVLKGNPAYLKSGERFYLGSPINTFETRI